MKHNIYSSMSAVLISLIVIGCSSQPNKAQPVVTQLQNSEPVQGQQVVGVKNDQMVVLDKAQASEKLRDLQNSVYGLEDQVYGTRKLGTLGLYGDLKACQRKLASKQYGGTGALQWSEPLDRVTDREEEFKMGLDEKNRLVGVSEEFLRDRIQRFQSYNHILKMRADDLSNRITVCKTELSGHVQNPQESSTVLVDEVPKVGLDKAAISQFMCQYVHAGASLDDFMKTAFARGWLTLADFQLNQNLIGAALKDKNGEVKPNCFLFSGWKLSFDQGQVTVGQLLTQSRDARLQAWAYDHKSEVVGAEKCLTSADGTWNK